MKYFDTLNFWWSIFGQFIWIFGTKIIFQRSLLPFQVIFLSMLINTFQLVYHTRISYLYSLNFTRRPFALRGKGLRDWNIILSSTVGLITLIWHQLIEVYPHFIFIGLPRETWWTMSEPFKTKVIGASCKLASTKYRPKDPVDLNFSLEEDHIPDGFF